MSRAGALAKGWWSGRSPRRASAQRQGSPRRSSSACSRSSRAFPVPSSCWCSGRAAPGGTSHPTTAVGSLRRRGWPTVSDRPYTLLSCSISMDGYLDDAREQRLVLSNDADLDRVDGVRAGCDAILVGAATIRRDDPRLLVREPDRVRCRLARGLPASPVKVTLTQRADLDPNAQFFTSGCGDKLVYCATPGLARARERLGEVATVLDGGQRVDVRAVLDDLRTRGVHRLMVEGGGSVHTQFLQAGVADELQLVVAPFFVGDSRAPRVVNDGMFPWNPDHRATLADLRRIGDLVLLRYALSRRFHA